MLRFCVTTRIAHRQAHVHRPTAYVRRRGFTLIELLVVVGIAILLLALMFPFINMMGRAVRGGAGINTVNVAVTAARAFAVRDMSGLYAESSTLKYHGVAILFTPANELRLIETNPHAESGGSLLQSTNQVGYTDIPNRDIINLPRSVTAYGITRDPDDGGALKLIAPPFAIRFDPKGRLIVSDPAWNGLDDLVVIYQPLRMDGLTDAYDTTSTRTNFQWPDGGSWAGDYTPDAWNPRINAAVGRDVDTRMYPLPFQCITAVVGVILVPTPEFRNAVSNPDLLGQSNLPGIVNGDSPLGQWMLSEGELLFFSRQTGVVMRER